MASNIICGWAFTRFIKDMLQSKYEDPSDKILENGNIRPLSYEKQVFRCQIQICKAEFVSNQLLQNHYKLDHPSKCERCKLIFTLKIHLKHHIKSVHETKVIYVRLANMTHPDGCTI